jgi:hypothetical protein
MAGGMVFRKDCGDCGRSFFTPDRKTQLCPRCTEAAQKRKQPAKDRKEKEQSEAFPTPEGSKETRSPLTPTDGLEAQISMKHESRGNRNDLSGGKPHKEGAGKPKPQKRPVAQTVAPTEAERALTKEQEQEVIGKYQSYVEAMERPSSGRRKTIASEMELPYRTIVLTVRKWCQGHPEAKDLSREERFAVERSFYRLLEKGSSFRRLKEQIAEETGFSLWQVSRCLDLLHDGEERLRKIPDVSPPQSMTILAEYRAYLSAPAPPGPPLHALIAERTGVNSQQAHKVLLAYRLGRFREVLT